MRPVALSDVGRAHLLGVCGSGMAPLALWLAHEGISVSGCDSAPEGRDRSLLQAGVEVLAGHDEEHVEGSDLVVHSAALPLEHPELERARELGVRTLRRSEALALLTEGRPVIAVAGAHGKTTTTAMAGWILQEVGLDPTVMAGGSVSPWGAGFRPGGELCVLEADEYDRAFLRLSPTVAAVTSFACEHLECYGGPEQLAAAFGFYLESTVPGGTAVVPAHLEHLAAWAARIGRRVVLTGPGGSLRLRAGESSGGWDLDFSVDGVHGTLPVPGEHNLRNAEIALAAALEAGAGLEECVRALATFPGVARRLERVGSLAGATAVSDYAHHPEEMEAAIGTLLGICRRPLLVVFQPHLYSRTAACHHEMGSALAMADRALVLPVYPAREDPLPGVDSELVSKSARLAGADSVPCQPEELPQALLVAGAGTVVFMGAGTVDAMARRLAREMP